MGNVTFSIPKDVTQAFREHGRIRNFVETGTYQGGSCFWAATVFENVFTIEIDPEISRKTSQKPECPPNIRFFVGNSRHVLPRVIEELQGRGLFWLDGHWCNVSELGKEDECPLLGELETMQALQDAVIMIDDARLFFGNPNFGQNKAQWPKYRDIAALLRRLFPRHTITISDDVIFCIPPDLVSTYKALRPSAFWNLGGANQMRARIAINRFKDFVRPLIKPFRR